MMENIETTNKTESGYIRDHYPALESGYGSENPGQFLRSPRADEVRSMIPISDLNDARYGLRDPAKNPILAYVSEEDGQFKVQVPELEAFAYADCIEDAMIELVAEIVQMCEEVLEKPDSSLGRAPRLWKGFLQSKIAKRG